jgi:hypothetical protein
VGAVKRIAWPVNAVKFGTLSSIIKSARMMLLSSQNTMFLSYWEDLLDAVKKCKAAGVTLIGASWRHMVAEDLNSLFLMER